MPAASLDPERLSPPVVMERWFDAPCEQVFAALTQAAPLRAWMGPAGCPITHATVDLRPGGRFHYGMQMPDGQTVWGQWTYRDISPPTRLVVVVQFSDAEGGVRRHPMAADWPLTTLSTTTLSAQAHRTRMQLSWQTLNATEAEEALFQASHAGLRQGWGGTMDQLATYLATHQAHGPIHTHQG